MKKLFQLRFRRTTILTAGYGAFLAGVALSYYGHDIRPAWLWLLVFLLVLFHQRTVSTLVLVACLACGLGMWRGQLFMVRLATYAPFYGEKITLNARALDDAVYGKGGQLSFDADHVQLDNGTVLTGKIQVSGFGVNSVYQGDELQVTGKLFPGFGAYQGRVSYAQLTLIDHHPSLAADIRCRFAAGVQSALPEPLAPFVMGLLIGQRATLPDDIKKELTMVGLTHIIAVSGYNLTIILQASRKLFGKVSKRTATFLALALIGLFLLLTGASASIVRAAIVSVLSITVAYYGRDFKPINLILLAAAITVWANPVFIWSDISWYLSFLAFYGVMVLAPALSERLRPGRELPLVAAVALESICAEVMTLPYILHTFGQMSFIGLPANVLVVTLVPLAMLLGTIAGLAGMAATPLAGWLAWPAKLLLTYMLDVAHTLSHLPHIFIENIGFSLPQMLAAYTVIIMVVLSLRYQIKPKNGKITERKDTERIHVRSLEMVND